ncbi:MAG: SH3 domain-containing protein, partial [Chloroflexota bacterium]
MNFLRRIPLATRIYLTLLVYLAAALGVLALARYAGMPLTPGGLAGWLAGRTPTPAQPTPAPFPTPAPTATYPPGVAWLRAGGPAPILSDPRPDSQALALLNAGDTAQVIGVSPDQQYWAIRVPLFESGQGWVPAGQVIVQNSAGVPVIEAGPGGPKPGGPLPTDQLPLAEMTTTVNVRKLPGLDAARIGTLKPGELLPAEGLSEDGFWVALKLPDGRTGWVSIDYVRLTNKDNLAVVTIAPTVLGTRFPTAAPGSAFLVSSWSVNIRGGPGGEYPVIGQMSQGETAPVVGRSADGTWWQIAYFGAADQLGWVAADYVQVANPQGVPV